ncbi:MAG: hypothetical protein K2L85_01910 [Paramuribaculum sp.]|nr:hypothetical protein [Paramuribaculum sp.]
MDLISAILLSVSVMPADSAMASIASPAYRNPVVNQWMLPRSHNAIGAAYRNEHYNKAAYYQKGTGEDYWSINADSYLKHGTSTVWGDASYRNGCQRAVVWNETSDAELLYPYLTADSVGGDLNFERYRFAGGYADSRGNWAWGASVSYTAGLYYRNVDPRPRNVTGLLDVAAGVGHRITRNYFGALSVNYRKYKQTSDIDFVSQIGVEKIYHLTGLGTHYSRFAGVGAESYYNGNRIGVTANIYPSSGRGLALTANLSRFRFEKVLTALNKLPLADVWHNSMELQGVWMMPGRVHDWGLAAGFDIYRRHGHENIFGDASSNVFPLIASLDMYADNAWTPSLTAVWQFHPGKSGFFLSARTIGRWIHRSEVYSTPRRRMLTNRFNVETELLASWLLGHRWRMTAAAGAAFFRPFGCSLRLDEAESQTPGGLVSVERRRYESMAANVSDLNFRFGLQKSISSRLELALFARWNHQAYVASIRSNIFSASLSVVF